MTVRTFATAPGLIHDPATGLTYPHPGEYVGRRRLDDEWLPGADIAPPGDLPDGLPRSLCWSPIVRCNLSCLQCLDDTGVAEAGAAERHRIAGILADAGVLGVDISGGEPLLLRDLPALAHTVAAGGRTAVSVTTNGWHLARRAAELVGAVDAVRISFDGGDDLSHDTIRGAGSFARAVGGVRAAVEAALPIQLQTVLMADTVAGAQRVIDLAVRLGAGGVTFLQMLPLGAGATHTDQMLTDEQATEAVAALDAPRGFRLRLRTRTSAGGFIVVRADGQVWRNDRAALTITGLHPLTSPADLTATTAVVTR